MVLVITVVVVFPLVKYQWYGIGGHLLQEILIGVITEKHFSIMFLCSSAVWDLNNNYRSWYLCEALVVCVSECCSWWLFSVAVVQSTSLEWKFSAADVLRSPDCQTWQAEVCIHLHNKEWRIRVEFIPVLSFLSLGA